MQNIEIIRNCGQDVMFGVDATNLENYFTDKDSFDIISFNFPHWRGKQNNRKNRYVPLNMFVPFLIFKIF